MSKKNKIIHFPKLHNAMGAAHNAYIKAMLAHPKKYPADFVETLIKERKKQLMKEKNVPKK
jgi:predicted metal-dependent phosphoesterase TrpH